MRSSLYPGWDGDRYWSVGVPARGPSSRVNALRSTAKLTACRSFGLFLKSGRLVLRTSMARLLSGLTKNCDLLTP